MTSLKEYKMPEQSIPKDKKFCPSCGEIKRIKYFNEGLEVCMDCEEKMLHTHIRWYGFPIALAVICVCVLSVLLAVKTVPAAKLVFDSDALARESRITDAFDKIEEAQAKIAAENTVLAEKFPKYSWFDTGLRTWEKYYSLMAASMTRLDAAYTVEKRVHSDILKSGSSELFAEYQQIADAYDKMSAGLSDITSGYSFDKPEDVPYDEVIKKMNALLDSGSNDFERAYNCYFKSSVAQYVYGSADKRCLSLLEDMVKIMPDEAVIYADVLFDAGKTSGDYAKLTEICDGLIAKNRNCGDAYEYKAKALIYGGEYGEADKVMEEMKKYNGDNPTYYALKIMSALRQNDIKSAVAISKKGDEANSEAVDAVFSQYLARSENISSKDSEMFKQELDFSMYQGAAMLLSGDYKSAGNLVYNYVYYYAYYYAYITGDQSIITQSVIDMTALAAYFAKDDEAMSAATEMGEYSDTVKKIIDGKLTLGEVFVEGKAELI